MSSLKNKIKKKNVRNKKIKKDKGGDDQLVFVFIWPYASLPSVRDITIVAKHRMYV